MQNGELKRPNDCHNNTPCPRFDRKTFVCVFVYAAQGQCYETMNAHNKLLRENAPYTQGYKTFYGRNFRIFLISFGVRHCQAYPCW